MASVAVAATNIVSEGGAAPSINHQHDKKFDDDEVSLDNLTCSNCHLSHATDTNDMLLCDGVGCFRAFHMECLEPKLTSEELKDVESWFCPLCMAHGNLIYYARK